MPSQVEVSAMPVARQKQPDQERIIASLAAESHVPINDVATLFEHERARLASGAHITKFLHIIAIRSVRKILRKRGLDKPALTLGASVLRAV
jgi:uncharacterized protein DUF3562